MTAWFTGSAWCARQPRQRGADDARFLAIFTPAAPGMERFFERFAEEAARGSGVEAFAGLAEDAGMTVLGPPLAESHPLP